jgi:hypothetical protein
VFNRKPARPTKPEWPRGAEIDAETNLVKSSGLFDVSYYLLNGGDVAEAQVDPVEHFCIFGWREGRRPNPFFDPRWYCQRYIGGIEYASNPLVHYIRLGERAGFHPISYIDPAWYRRHYGLAGAESSLGHYLKHRRTQRVSPNPAFELPFYLDRHRVEIGPNRDPFMHFVRHGAALRDHDPSPVFDSARYRREVMAFDRTVRTGLMAHEMRVPLIHWLDGLIPSGTP